MTYTIKATINGEVQERTVDSWVQLAQILQDLNENNAPNHFITDVEVVTSVS